MTDTFNTLSRASAYSEAMSAFRHYDTLSATTIGAIPITVVGVCTLLHNVENSSWRFIIPLASVGFIWFLFRLYARLDIHAATALRVAACLERDGYSDGEPILGLASAREAIDDCGFPSLESENGGNIYEIVRTLTFSSIVLMILLLVLCIGSSGKIF